MYRDLTWKVCRVHDLSTARLCAALGVDLIGLHAINSLPAPRAQAFAQIRDELQEYYPNTKPVLVTKVTSSTELAAMVKHTGIGHLQIHAPINLTDIATIERDITSSTGAACRFIVVLSATDPASPTRIKALKRWSRFIDYVLIDTSWQGGTGQVAPSRNLATLLRLARPLHCLIAGGLNEHNVRDIVNSYNPAGIDIQSGLEMSVPGHPKDPQLIRRVGALIKPTYSTRTFLVPPRPLVSISTTSSSVETVEVTLQRLVETDIDIVHLDHSDGSMLAEQWEPTNVARALRSISPCLPYDLHLFVRNPYAAESLLSRYLAVNPLLRVVFFHIDSPHANVSAVSHLVSYIADHGMGVGLAIQSKKFNAGALIRLLHNVPTLPVCDVCLVLPSAQHSLLSIEQHDVPLLRVLHTHSRSFPLPFHVSVDREMTLERLQVLEPAKPSHVVIGARLISANDPQQMINRLRMNLDSPIHYQYNT